MTRTFGLLALMTLAACGMGENKFQDKFAVEACRVLTECDNSGISFSSAGECEAFYGAFMGIGTSGCDYDAGAAKQCISDLAGATCEDSNSISSCDEVYTGATCGWSGSGTTSTGTFTAGDTGY